MRCTICNKSDDFKKKVVFYDVDTCLECYLSYSEEPPTMWELLMTDQYEEQEEETERTNQPYEHTSTLSES